MPEPGIIPAESGRRFLTRWTLFWLAVWAGAFVMTHTPMPRGVAMPFRYGDLVWHFCAYFTLALLGWKAAQSRQVRIDARWLTRWLIIYALYGIADELLQGPVGRSPQILDWLANVAGAAAALGIAYVNRPIASSSESAPAVTEQLRADSRNGG